ncbi:MAG: Asp23/Gls24 family envelope stress response protein [Ruminococcaceae bacterium]|nr:Asp23/Gls24 family envelope stress response protein [Oscillospiraceae bacterium]
MKKYEEENINTTVETGDITVSENVIASIAKNALSEIEEVHSVVGESSDSKSFLDMISDKATGKDKGIKVEFKENNELNIEVFVVLKYGTNLISVSKVIQEKIKDAVESIAGMHVLDIDVFIEGVVAE